MIPFSDRLAHAVRRLRAPACVGIDPHLDRLPPALFRPEPDMDPTAYRAHAAQAVQRWALAVVEVLAGRVPAVKPQSAFFEALGSPGVAALEAVVARARALGLVVILDAKRGDIGSTARAYASAALNNNGPLGADAVTVSPYLGPESLHPFVEHGTTGKGLFVLVRTSNPGAEAWQLQGEPSIASQVAQWIERANTSRLGAHQLGPVGAVFGATLGSTLARWRSTMPHTWWLVPGFGAQGAGPSDVRACFRPDGLGALVTSSRGVLFGDPSQRDWQQGVADRADAFVAALRTVTEVFI